MNRSNIYKTNKSDWVVIVTVLFFISMFFYKDFIRNSDDNKKEAVISFREEVIARVPLDNNQKISINLKNGETARVQISDGRIRVTDLECPKKICINTGWIKLSGEKIICIPNQFIIEIIGKNSVEDVELDIVV